MFPPIFPPRLSQKWHMTVTENKKYPPKNKYYTPVFSHPDTFALEN